MCEEESEDPEAVNKLLEINDSIHRTIERYKLVKKGDHDAASRIPKGTLGTTTGVSKNANNELSLIDFDPEPAPNGNAPQPAAQGTSSVENDLLGLSLDEPVPATGGISLGPGRAEAITRRIRPADFLVGNPMAGPSAPSFTPPPPQPGRSAADAKFDILSAFNSSQPISQSSTPAPSLPQPQPTATPPPPADPFASLVSGGSRGASPFPPTAARSQQPAPASTSLLDLAGTNPSAQAPGPAATGKAPEDDEWNFASSLPPSGGLPSTNRVQVLNSSLRIEFVARRHPNQPQQIHVVALFSNATSQPLNDLHFQVAVEKVSLTHSCLSMCLCMYACMRADANGRLIGVHPAASTPIRSGNPSIAAEWGAAGDSTGRN